MKHPVLAVAAGSLLALPAFAMPPEDANYAPTVSAAPLADHTGERHGPPEDANYAPTVSATASKALAAAQPTGVAILKTEPGLSVA